MAKIATLDDIAAVTGREIQRSIVEHVELVYRTKGDTCIWQVRSDFVI
jgi:hypothetical protein